MRRRGADVGTSAFLVAPLRAGRPPRARRSRRPWPRAAAGDGDLVAPRGARALSRGRCGTAPADLPAASAAAARGVARRAPPRPTTTPRPPRRSRRRPDGYRRPATRSRRPRSSRRSSPSGTCSATIWTPGPAAPARRRSPSSTRRPDDPDAARVRARLLAGAGRRLHARPPAGRGRSSTGPRRAALAAARRRRRDRARTRATTLGSAAGLRRPDGRGLGAARGGDRARSRPASLRGRGGARRTGCSGRARRCWSSTTARERWLREGIEYAERVELWNHRHYMAAHLAHVAVGDRPLGRGRGDRRATPWPTARRDHHPDHGAARARLRGAGARRRSRRPRTDRSSEARDAGRADARAPAAVAGAVGPGRGRPAATAMPATAVDAGRRRATAASAAGRGRGLSLPVPRDRDARVTWLRATRSAAAALGRAGRDGACAARRSRARCRRSTMPRASSRSPTARPGQARTSAARRPATGWARGRVSGRGRGRPSTWPARTLRANQRPAAAAAATAAARATRAPDWARRGDRTRPPRRSWRHGRTRRRARAVGALTAREFEVARLVADGLTNAEIADGAGHRAEDRRRARRAHPGQARRSAAGPRSPPGWPRRARATLPRLTATTERSSAGTAPKRARDGASRAGPPA